MTFKENPDISEELAFKIVKSIPSGYEREDIVTESYYPNSVISCNFVNFLLNGENKARMVAILFRTLERKNQTFWTIWRPAN